MQGRSNCRLKSLRSCSAMMSLCAIRISMRSEVTQCATSLVAQNVNAVFTISIDPGPMGSTLNDAKERGIPFIGTVSEVAKTPLLIDYGSPGVASAQLSANWLFEEAKKRKGSDAELKFTISERRLLSERGSVPPSQGAIAVTRSIAVW